jgi:hypothetical protein
MARNMNTNITGNFAKITTNNNLNDLCCVSCFALCCFASLPGLFFPVPGHESAILEKFLFANNFLYTIKVKFAGFHFELDFYQDDAAPQHCLYR